MHDGSKLLLKKLEEDYDPTDKISALQAAARDRAPRRVRDRPDLHRARPRRLPHAAERGRRAAGAAAARARAAGPPEALEEIMEGAAVAALDRE